MSETWVLPVRRFVVRLEASSAGEGAGSGKLMHFSGLWFRCLWWSFECLRGQQALRSSVYKLLWQFLQCLCQVVKLQFAGLQGKKAVLILHDFKTREGEEMGNLSLETHSRIFEETRRTQDPATFYRQPTNTQRGSELESNIYECVLLKLNFSLKSPPFPVKENQMKTNLFVKQVWF